MQNEQIETTQLAMRMEDNTDFVADMTSATMSYTSIQAFSPLEKARLFNIMNNPKYRLSNFVNMTLFITDIYCETVTCTNEETGEKNKAPRIILIDQDGEGYACVSIGIFSALKKLINSFGEPTWEIPLPLMVKQIKKGKKSITTVELNAEEMEKLWNPPTNEEKKK